MTESNMPQTELLPQVSAAEVNVPAITAPMDSKRSELGNFSSSSKVDKPHKAVKKSSIKSNVNSILIYLMFAATFLLALSAGLTGTLLIVEKKLHEVQADIDLAAGRNAVELWMRYTLDAVTQKPLPLRLFETHAGCLVRGVNVAYSRFLPYDYSEYSDIRDQTIAWIEESCAKKFTPQAPQSQQQPFLVTAWKLWSQRVGDVVHVMKQRLGKARGMILAKWAGKTSNPRSTPPAATNHFSAPLSAPPTLKLDYILMTPSIKLEVYDYSRYRLVYNPLIENFSVDSVMFQEPLTHIVGRLERLHVSHGKIERTLWSVRCICFLTIVLENIVLFLLRTPKSIRVAPKNQKKTCRAITWRNVWEEMNDLELGHGGVVALQWVTFLLDVSLLALKDRCPPFIYAGLVVIGFTGTTGFLAAACDRIPFALFKDELSNQMDSLANMAMQRPVPKEHEGGDHINQDTTKSGSLPLGYPFPNRRISLKTSFQEDLALEVQLRRLSKNSIVAPASAHTTEPAIFEGTRDESEPKEDVFVDIGLYSSDSDTGSDWSIVEAK